MVLLSLLGYQSQAQDFGEDTSMMVTPFHLDAPIDKFSVGAGMGYEYGGLGVHAIYYPIPYVGFFAGGGWYYVKPGYNVGVKVRAFVMAPSVLFIPHVEFLYGTNTYIYYKHNTGYDTLFRNFTFGGGVDFRPDNWKFGYLSFSVYVPLRSPDVKNYTNGRIDYFYGITPTDKLYFANFSLGFKFIISSKKLGSNVPVPVTPP